MTDINSYQPITGRHIKEDGTIINTADSQPVNYHGGQLDAFSRLRVSQPLSLFNHINYYGLDSDIFETIKSGAGTSVTYLPNENSDSLAVGTVSGEYTIRQTFRYFPYTPGKSQAIFLTAVFGAGVANITKRIGYFDDGNGLFFELAGSVLSVVRRTSTSGSVVDVSIAQSSWNLDKLDGTGASGITLDVSKAQILVIDFQWLGVGRVRFGFDIDGILYYCHEMLHANVLDTVYMTTPSLPIRYEIRNTGTSAGGTLKQICVSVASEGGIIPEGEQFAAGHGTASRSVTGARIPVFAIRMAAALNGKQNRRIAKILHTHVYAVANDVYMEIIHGHIPTAITATWVAVGGDSGVEYSSDISVATFTDEHRMAAFYSNAGQAQKGEVSLEVSEIQNEHDRIYNNHDCSQSTYIVAYAAALASTSTLRVSMGWIEY